MYGRGCQASPRSREQIDAALARTRAWLGSTSAAPEAWTGSLYQSANRLAHLYFLNELLGVRSWLVHLLFVDDPHSPTHADKSDKAIQAADTELGLEQDVLRAGYVLLPAVSADISP